MEYKYPEWLTTGGNIKTNAEYTTIPIASLAEEVDRCNTHNTTEYWRRRAMLPDLLKLSEMVFGENHRITRQIRRWEIEIPKPYDLNKLFVSLKNKIHAVEARKEAARLRRVRAQLRKMPDQDWPAK